jgi:Leucine-rich repeat (LRR) protein
MSASKSSFAARVLLFLCLFCGVSAYAEVVVFPDPGLDAAVREAIGKPAGDITDTDLSGLISLDAGVRGISNLSGLEHCTMLSWLDLSTNQISDIRALSGLTSLTLLLLSGNQISDISALSGLTSLTQLELGANQISDISALSGLASLALLCLDQNQISDVSALSGLANLTSLHLWANQISDISALSGLTNLTILALYRNQISDISALSGLANLTILILGYNQISDISALSGLTNLTILSLGGIQISDISALSGLANLTSLELNENQISDISALSGLANLTSLHLWSNQISDIRALSGLASLTELALDTNQISDISALSNLTNLTDLRLGFNQISNLSPLTALTDLTRLTLEDNLISDIMPLVICPGLGPDDQVFLNGNPLSQQALCEQIPELQARWVWVTYDGECESTSGCGMFEILEAEGSAIAAVQGGALGLPTNYWDWDIERWPVVPYGDGMPDLWQLRLFADAYCNDRHRLHEIVLSVYEANLATLLTEKPEAALSWVWAAATMGLSTNMRAAICEIYALEPDHYQVYREPGKGADEPFSAEGDCDGDGVSNVEEYEYVVASGGDIDDFAMQAAENSPFWSGNPDVPALNAIGLVLLALGIGLGGAWLLTRSLCREHF